MTTTGARGCSSSPTSASFSVTMPAIGAVTDGIGDRLLPGRDLRGRGGDAGARGVDLFPARRRRAAARRFRAPRARGPARPARARSRRPAAPPHRRAVCASRSWRRAASRSARRRHCAAASSASAARTSVSLAATAASAWRMSSARAPARSRRSCASACSRSALARASASSASAVSRRATRSPGLTRSPSATRSSSTRPPTWAATCTSVASTCPDTRTRSAGGLSWQAAASTAKAASGARNIRAAVRGRRCGVMRGGLTVAWASRLSERRADSCTCSTNSAGDIARMSMTCRCESSFRIGVPAR